MPGNIPFAPRHIWQNANLHFAFWMRPRATRSGSSSDLGVSMPRRRSQARSMLRQLSQLQALPLDGKIVLRTYKEDEEEQPAKGKPSKK